MKRQKYFYPINEKYFGANYYILFVNGGRKKQGFWRTFASTFRSEKLTI